MYLASMLPLSPAEVLVALPLGLLFGLIGGLFSFLWIGAASIVVFLFPERVARHDVLWCLLGSTAVIGSIALSSGNLLQEAAISCAVSSICFIVLMRRRPPLVAA